MKRAAVALVLVAAALAVRGCIEAATADYDVTGDGRVDLSDALAVLDHFGEEQARAIPVVVIQPADYPLPNPQQPYTLAQAAQAVCQQLDVIAADFQAQLGVTFRATCAAVVSRYSWAELHPDGAGLDGCAESVLPGGEGYGGGGLGLLRAEVEAMGIFAAGSDVRTVLIPIGGGGVAHTQSIKSFGGGEWAPGQQNVGAVYLGDWRMPADPTASPCCVARWNEGFCAAADPWPLAHELRHSTSAPELGPDPFHAPPVGCCGETLTEMQRAQMLAPRNAYWLRASASP